MRPHVHVPRTGRLECREETIAVERSMRLPRCHGMLAPPPRLMRAEQADEGCTRADEQADEGCVLVLMSKLMRAVLVLMSKLMRAILVLMSKLMRAVLLRAS